MYKHKNKTRLEQSGQPLHWIKRKLLLIITAFMLGISKGMNVHDGAFKGNQTYTEHNKD